jgi:predicted signal transduction protein with EAL and GGDEF domain
VLIGFANACQRHLRSNHVFGRFGGEEFLLIMPDTREDQVFDVFERLREIVGELTVSGLPESHRLSFSMGSAEVKVETASLEALIKEADLALYRAKEKGRDRCEIHQGALQASYDASVLRARPYQQAPMAYERAARLQTVTPAKIASVAPVQR